MKDVFSEKHQTLTINLTWTVIVLFLQSDLLVMDIALAFCGKYGSNDTTALKLFPTRFLHNLVDASVKLFAAGDKMFQQLLSIRRCKVHVLYQM